VVDTDLSVWYDTSEVMEMEKVYPIRKLDQIARIKRNLKTEKTAVWYALFVIGINTNLRVSDLLGLKWANVWIDGTTTLRDHIELTEQKTGKKRRIKLTKPIAEALAYLLENIREPEAGDNIIRNPLTRKPYSREHISRTLAKQAKAVGIQDSLGIHGLRATWGFHAVISFHQPITLIQHGFNHSNQKQTMNYLGITDEQMTEVYETVVL